MTNQNKITRIILNHKYECDDGMIVDSSGVIMDSVDEFVEEMQMLLDECRRLKDIINEKDEMGTFVPNVAISPESQ